VAEKVQTHDDIAFCRDAGFDLFHEPEHPASRQAGCRVKAIVAGRCARDSQRT